MKNVICVDFTIMTAEQIKVFCEEYNFLYEVMLDLKNKKYHKVWFFSDGIGLAYNLCKDNPFGIKEHDKVRLFTDILKDLPNIKPYEPVPIDAILDVDTILEKIHKYGADSITKEEKNFLDNQ